MSTLKILNNINEYILYISYPIFIFGLIGNSLNLFIFTKLKFFRNNHSTFYLIIESIVNIFLLFLFCILQIIQINTGNDPSNISHIWCKIKTSFGQPVRLLHGSIICFQTFDQYLSTHHHISIRQLSTFKLVRYLIWITYSIWFIQSIPYLIYYNILPGYGCIIINEGLIYYYSYVYYIFFNGLIPILISSFFSILAYQNVRRLIQRRIPIKRRKLDRQMTAMIFARVITFIILLLPYTIYRIYILNIHISPSDILLNKINQLISTTVSILLSLIYTLNFYIFLIISSRFRRQVKYVIKKYWLSMKLWCKSNPNEILPLGEVSSRSALEID